MPVTCLLQGEMWWEERRGGERKSIGTGEEEERKTKGKGDIGGGNKVRSWSSSPGKQMKQLQVKVNSKMSCLASTTSPINVMNVNTLNKPSTQSEECFCYPCGENGHLLATESQWAHVWCTIRQWLTSHNAKASLAKSLARLREDTDGVSMAHTRGIRSTCSEKGRDVSITEVQKDEVDEVGCVKWEGPGPLHVPAGSSCKVFGKVKG